MIHPLHYGPHVSWSRVPCAKREGYVTSFSFTALVVSIRLPHISDFPELNYRLDRAVIDRT